MRGRGRPSDHERSAAEAWFRRRGLPFVVERSRRKRAVLRRSAPAQVYLLLLLPLLDYLLSRLDVSDDGSTGYAVGVLALLFAMVTVPAVAGWLVARWLDTKPERTQRIAAVVIVALWVFGVPILEVSTGLEHGFWAFVGQNAAIAIGLNLLVRIGIGSVLVWAARNALDQVKTIGSLASRALPLMLLVVLFSFFTAELWQAVERLSRFQLWMALLFLGAVGAAFLAGMLVDEMRELRSGHRPLRDRSALLRGTPFENDKLTERSQELRISERLNILLVLFFTEAVQIVAFAVLVFLFFIVFGALILQPEVITLYAGRESGPGSLFGVKLPVKSALVQVSLFLGGFSGLYFAASTATDARYRQAFFEPLLDEVAKSLAARDAYLVRWVDVESTPPTTLEGHDIP
ncbi:hypothetical protein AB5J62_39715 [Amycolatopsis sp. cg5]|uniref:hypothetical protein n=1 Tax=Amycolatopsis sp. cg5 TaxID=3238802 RepID=UPI003524610D